MSISWYDYIARSTGGYGYPWREQKVGPDGEDEFLTTLEFILFKEAVVLDIGCGDGSLMLEVAQKTREVVGIDASSEMIEIARKVAALRDISNVSFMTAKIKSAALPSCQFDILYSRRGPLSWLPGSAHALKPGGYVLELFPGSAQNRELAEVGLIELKPSPTLEERVSAHESAGMKVVSASEYQCSVQFSTTDDLLAYTTMQPGVNVNDADFHHKFERLKVALQNGETYEIIRSRVLVVSTRMR